MMANCSLSTAGEEQRKKTEEANKIEKKKSKKRIGEEARGPTA
jgi:hypothetical protein